MSALDVTLLGTSSTVVNGITGYISQKGCFENLQCECKLCLIALANERCWPVRVHNPILDITDATFLKRMQGTYLAPTLDERRKQQAELLNDVISRREGTDSRISSEDFDDTDCNTRLSDITMAAWGVSDGAIKAARRVMATIDNATQCAREAAFGKALIRVQAMDHVTGHPMPPAKTMKVIHLNGSCIFLGCTTAPHSFTSGETLYFLRQHRSYQREFADETARYEAFTNQRGFPVGKSSSFTEPGPKLILDDDPKGSVAALLRSILGDFPTFGDGSLPHMPRLECKPSTYRSYTEVAYVLPVRLEHHQPTTPNDSFAGEEIPGIVVEAKDKGIETNLLMRCWICEGLYETHTPRACHLSGFCLRCHRNRINVIASGLPGTDPLQGDIASSTELHTHCTRCRGRIRLLEKWGHVSMTFCRVCKRTEAIARITLWAEDAWEARSWTPPPTAVGREWAQVVTISPPWTVREVQ